MAFSLSRKEDDEDFLRRYLLGEVSEEERSRWEEQLFTDDESFHQTVTAEYDLVDEYVRGELSQEDRQRFEDRLLRTTAQRDRVRLAEAVRAELPSAGDALATQERSGTWWVGLAAAISLLVGGLWLVGVRGRSDGSQGGQVEDRQQPAAPQVESGSQVPSPSLPTAVFMTLLPGRTRSPGEQKPLGITNGVTTVQLQLNLEQDEYPRYDASLETPQGRTIWREAGVTSAQTASGRKAVTLAVPARFLGSGDYVIRLTGITAKGGREAADDYTFRAVRR